MPANHLGDPLSTTGGIYSRLIELDRAMDAITDSDLMTATLADAVLSAELAQRIIDRHRGRVPCSGCGRYEQSVVKGSCGGLITQPGCLGLIR